MDTATTSPMDHLHSFNSCTEHTGNGSHTCKHARTHTCTHIHTHNNLLLKFPQFLVHALKDLPLLVEVVNMLLQGGILCWTTVEAFEGLQDTHA